MCVCVCQESICAWVLLHWPALCHCHFRLIFKTCLSRHGQDQCTASRLLSACFRIPVFVDWQTSASRLCDWIPLDSSLRRLVWTTAFRSTTRLRRWSLSPAPQLQWILPLFFQLWWKALQTCPASKHGQSKMCSLSVSALRPAFSFVFEFPDSIKAHDAMRKSVICILHT